MKWKKRQLKLKKRNCEIKMCLVPYGSGWTDVYLNIGDDSLYFIISSVLGNQFDDLLRILYHLYPDNNDPENADDIVNSKYGICEKTEDGYQVVSILDDLDDIEPPFVEQGIPWKSNFTWDEEGACSNWTLEREPTQNTDFMLRIHIEHCGTATKVYDYEVPYQDFCYAVAKACTEMLKEYGFFGYHHSVYNHDINVRHLLFLKSIALNNFDARQLTYYDEKGHGATTDLQKELALLIFDM